MTFATIEPKSASASGNSYRPRSSKPSSFLTAGAAKLVPRGSSRERRTRTYLIDHSCRAARTTSGTSSRRARGATPPSNTASLGSLWRGGFFSAPTGSSRALRRGVCYSDLPPSRWRSVEAAVGRNTAPKVLGGDRRGACALAQADAPKDGEAGTTSAPCSSRARATTPICFISRACSRPTACDDAPLEELAPVVRELTTERLRSSTDGYPIDPRFP